MEELTSFGEIISNVFKNISLDDIVIIDNSVLSFAFHLDNGIPILPYYSGSDEKEMKCLVQLLEK